MGILLVIGLGVLGWGVTRGMHTATSHGGGADGGSTFTAEVMLPPGSHLEQMTTAGDRIVLRLSGGESERILVVDPHSGQVSGRITLVPDGR
ncbi:MAG TPA: hypothetical protein HPQ04_09740 [Rhodospirillaceae bacterium]|nr:hypothetical protein [Rhodospirillaceae bacterium]